MFYNFCSLITLNLSNFNNNTIKDMRSMFCYILKKCQIILNDSAIKESLTKEGIPTKFYIYSKS